jgi:hypothetical protein
MPSKTSLKMAHIERMPGTKTNMTLPILLLGKLRPKTQLVINTGLRKIRLPRREAKNLCRPLSHMDTQIHTASGALIQIDSLLGMTIKLMR